MIFALLFRNPDNAFVLAGGGILAFEFGGLWAVLACAAAGVALFGLVLLLALAWDRLRRRTKNLPMAVEGSCPTKRRLPTPMGGAGLSRQS